MKQLIFFSIIMLLSCSKNSVKPKERNLSLAGKWILSEVLADPGDGSGKWTTVDKPGFYFVQFNADKTVKTNMAGRFENAEKYFNKDSTLSLIYSPRDTINLYYKIKDPYLTITGGCFEACGFKFKTDL